MIFLITTSYRGHNKTIIWELSFDDNLVDLKKKKILRIYDNNLLPNVYDHAAFGITKVNKGYILSESNALRLVDKNFKELKRTQDTSFLRDLHDLTRIKDEIYVANSLRDSVEVFSLDLNHKKTIFLKKLPDLKDLNTWSKRNPTTISDCFHVNHISEHKGEIFLSLSFITLKKLHLKLKKIFPFFALVGKQTPGGIYNLTKQNFFAKNISGSHDGVWFDNQLWVTHTHNQSIDIFNEKGTLVRRLTLKDGALYRGLCVTDKYVFVGATKIDLKRAGAKNKYAHLATKRGGLIYDLSSILILDKKSFRVLHKLALPNFKGKSPEVYSISRA